MPAAPQQPRRISLEKRVLRLCFIALAGLAALHTIIFSIASSHAADAFSGFAVAWLLILPPIWLIARGASRWVLHHVEMPLASIIDQCHRIQVGNTERITRDEHADLLAPLSEAVDQLLSHSGRLVARQQRCIADAAHELRTPLTAQAVVGENVLARRASSAELREAVKSMLEEAKHMKRLLESLLTLSRVSATQATVLDERRSETPHDLYALAYGCVQSLQILAEEKQQSIEIKTGKPLWANVDSTLLRQAVLNIVHNAIEHCPSGARIEVETTRGIEGEGVVFVTDDGPGIPLADQPRVFERFYRGSGTSRSRGSGLGLAIARAILMAQGGRIWFESEPGQGCRFALAVPLAASADCIGQGVEHRLAPTHEGARLGDVGSAPLAPPLPAEAASS